MGTIAISLTVHPPDTEPSLAMMSMDSIPLGMGVGSTITNVSLGTPSSSFQCTPGLNGVLALRANPSDGAPNAFCQDFNGAAVFCGLNGGASLSLRDPVIYLNANSEDTYSISFTPAGGLALDGYTVHGTKNPDWPEWLVNTANTPSLISFDVNNTGDVERTNVSFTIHGIFTDREGKSRKHRFDPTIVNNPPNQSVKPPDCLPVGEKRAA